MSECERDQQQPEYSEVPDEILSVEDFGVRAIVNVWHSPIARIKTTFESLENSETEELIRNKSWIRNEKLHILSSKARLLGFTALTAHLDQLKLSSEIDETPEKPEITPVAEKMPEENYEPVLIESLQPGTTITVPHSSELADFETKLADEIHPNGIWGKDEKWAYRTPLSDLVKNFSLNGAKFNGTVTDIKFEVMANPVKRLLETQESKEEAKFIFSEKLPYRLSRDLIHTLEDGTIGFAVSMNIKSSKGIRGTVRSELWYTKIDTNSSATVRRFMTRPVLQDVSKTNADTSKDNVVSRRRGPIAQTVSQKTPRYPTLR